MLEGKTPDQVVVERLTAKPALAKDKPSGQASPCDITKARLIADRAMMECQPHRDLSSLRALFGDGQPLDSWLVRWRARCADETDTIDSTTAAIERAQSMRSVNPIVIARNHRVEEALAAASDHDELAPFQNLLEAVRRPYDEVPERAYYAEPAPPAVTACYRTFCGT